MNFELITAVSAGGSFVIMLAAYLRQLQRDSQKAIAEDMAKMDKKVDGILGSIRNMQDHMVSHATCQERRDRCPMIVRFDYLKARAEDNHKDVK